MLASDRLRFCVLSAALSLAPHAFAQGPTVTQADIARAAQVRAVVTEKDVAEAAKKYRAPTDAEIARVPVPSMPNASSLPVPLSPRTVDLGALAGGYQQGSQVADGRNALSSGPALLIFISFSMPERTLRLLVGQAARAGATVVLRGFVDGSLKNTVQRVQALLGKNKVSIQIDPQAFDRFAVDSTPSFVLIKDGAVPAPCAAGTCFDSSNFVLAAGDVSVDYALQQFKRSTPAHAADVDRFLSRLKGG